MLAIKVRLLNNTQLYEISQKLTGTTWIDFVIREDENARDQSTFFKNKTQLQNEIGQKFAGILDWVTRILLFLSRSPQF